MQAFPCRVGKHQQVLSRGRAVIPADVRSPTFASRTCSAQALAEHDDADGKRTKARAVIDALIEMAIEHDGPAIGRIFDRIDGILQPIKTEAIDIRALIEEVAKRAQDRKHNREPGEPVR